jgi:parallel beta-helix repeat protein
MKKNNFLLRKSPLLILIGFLLASSILLTKISYVDASNSPNNEDFDFEALTPSLPIRIENDTAFSVNYGFPGAGTPGNPYRIEDLNITTSDTYGIYVTGTIMYFTIQNCYINAGDYGIYFTGVSDGVGNIDNNICEDNTIYGISLQDSLRMNITNNKCYYNGNAGIYTNYADYSRFINNTCKWNNIGIHLYDTYDSFVINNTCSENTFGIMFELIYGTDVEDNTCNDQQYGITLTDVSFLEVKDNECKNISIEGIGVWNGEGLNISLNYLDDVDDSALYIGNSLNCLVTNNTILNSYRGIFVGDSDYTNFTYNLIKDNTNYGVYADLSSEYNIYHHNAFISNALGVGSAQAYDVGNYSTWYDFSINEGNYWNEYIGPGNYVLDGDGEQFVDPYPLSESPIVPEFSHNQISFFFLLLIIVIPSVIVIRKRVRI